MADEKEEKPTTFSLPYPMVMEGETSVRNKDDAWRFRLLTNLIRQSPTQIKKIEERYEKKVNL